MPLTLKPGSRLFSAVCATEMIAVRAPTDEVDVTMELLCIKAGAGVPALDGEPLHLKEAKPLPASD